MEELNITWAYPDILNLHGDRANIQALEKVGKLLGLKVNIKKVENFEDEIDYENTDILFFNPGELKSVEYIINTLEEDRKELKKYIESNKVVIAIGTSGAIFSKRIVRINNGELIGLGFLDMTCTERKDIVGDDLILQLDDDMKLNGSQIQVIDTSLNSAEAFADVIYGYGNDGYEQKQDGARYKNLIFTNMLGPLFVKNPWFGESIIKTAMKNKKVNIDKQIDESEYEIEMKSMKAIIEFNENK